MQFCNVCNTLYMLLYVIYNITQYILNKLRPDIFVIFFFLNFLSYTCENIDLGKQTSSLYSSLYIKPYLGY